IRISALHARKRCFGHQSFKPHNGIRVRFGGFALVAGKLKDSLNMLDVTLTGLFGLVVLVRIVIAIRQAEATLVDLRNLFLGIIWVKRGTGTKNDGPSITELETSD